jgi:hypothetical protein
VAPFELLADRHLGRQPSDIAALRTTGMFRDSAAALGLRVDGPAGEAANLLDGSEGDVVVCFLVAHMEVDADFRQNLR